MLFPEIIKSLSVMPLTGCAKTPSKGMSNRLREEGGEGDTESASAGTA